MNSIFKIKFIDCKEEDLLNIGFDKSYIKKGYERHVYKSLKISSLNCAQANIIKQTAISVGCDCAVHREVITGKVESSDCIITASINQYKKISEKLKHQPFKLQILSQMIESLITEPKTPIFIRDKQITYNKTPIIMGILNVTPDSFSDGGQYNTEKEAIKHFEELVESGADIIDIGGESARPYSQKTPVEEEIKRIIPIIKAIREKDKQTIISVDTRNSKTAKAALETGADIINDISSLEWDPKMIEIIKNFGCPIILCHSSDTPDKMQNRTEYTDVVDDIINFFVQKIKYLKQQGISTQNIILDPGIGFGKTTEQNFEILKRIEEFKSLGCPILVGHSRKRFIQDTLNTNENIDLDKATVIISEYLTNKGIDIIRVHNAKEHKVLKILNNSLF